MTIFIDKSHDPLPFDQLHLQLADQMLELSRRIRNRELILHELGNKAAQASISYKEDTDKLVNLLHETREKQVYLTLTAMRGLIL